MKYNDFILTIEGKWEEGFLIKAVHKYGVGLNIKKDETGGPLPTFDAQRFFHNERQIKVFNEIQSAIHRRPYDHHFLTSFGEEMFRELFKEPIGKEFQFARKIATATQCGLRIRLQLPSVLQGLPWELMLIKDDTESQFLCLNADMALIRSGTEDESDSLQTVEFPLRILVVVSTPVDYPPLNTRGEINRLLQSLSIFISAGKVEIDFVDGPDTVSRLRELMKTSAYHILHFMGHSSEAGGPISMILEDDERKGRSYDSVSLFQRLRNIQPPSLVFLNACKGASTSVISPLTSIAESLLDVGVSAVIAHQFEISDEAAEVFSKHIYEGLVTGTPIEESMTTARCELSDEFPLECFTPVFFLRNTRGTLFLTRPGAQAREPEIELPIRRADEAARARRWSEAADYALTALLINHDHEQMKLRSEQALQQEELDGFLHQATFSKSIKDWQEVVNWCDQYLNHSLAQTRPKAERAGAALMKLEIYLRQARRAEQTREWADAASWYEQYMNDPARRERPAAEQERIAMLRQVAQLGAGVRDPHLRWKG